MDFLRISRIALAIAASASILFGLGACAHHSNVSVENAAPANASGSEGGSVLIPSGTVFYGKLQTPINTKTAQDGTPFTLVHTNTMFHKNATLNGDVIDGHLTNVKSAGMMHNAGMTIVFDDIRMPDGTKAPVNVRLISMKAFNPQTHHLRTLGMMAGGAIAGHMAASHAGKKHGGLMGAAGGYVLSQTMKTNIVVPAGTVLEVRFNAPVTASASGSAPETSATSGT